MSMLEQEFNPAASGAIVRPHRREQALSGFGWTGRRAEWITPVCLPRGVFARARWARFMDARAEQLRRGGPERPRLRRTCLSDAANGGEPAYPLGPRFARPGRGWRGAVPPLTPVPFLDASR